MKGKVIFTNKLSLNGKTVIIPVFEKQWAQNKLFKEYDQKTGSLLSKKAKLNGFDGKNNEVISLFAKLTANSLADFKILGLGKKNDFTNDNFQEQLAKQLKKLRKNNSRAVILILNDTLNIESKSFGRLLGEAFYLSQYRFDKYKSAPEEKNKELTSSEVFIKDLKPSEQKLVEKGLVEGQIISSGVALTRDLVNEPAINLSPSTIVNEAKKIVKNSHGIISVQILSEAQCRKLGMGAFLAVAQGSEEKPHFIILRRRGTGPKVVLVGKTIIFDSGGLSLKPSKSMETMKLDMAGGASVLGVFQILSNLSRSSKINADIYGILPACENMPSGKAIRPGDIVTALNGKTIEILNTDAEGRLALADALSYAEKQIKPEYIVDLATLTGAIMVALGEDIAGLFSNNKALSDQLVKAAELENEKMWEMPLPKYYMEQVKSNLADLRNISTTSYGGAITAALFLSEFVKNAKWAHIDIAGASFNEGGEKGIMAKGATGFGVKMIIRWLMNEFSQK